MFSERDFCITRVLRRFFSVRLFNGVEHTLYYNGVEHRFTITAWKDRFTFMRYLFLFLAIFCGFSLSAQSRLTWQQLADVSFEKIEDKENSITYNEATFGEKLMLLDSTEVYTTGYLIPIDAMGITYALSRNPNASCFFCGGAGPETVILLRIKPEHYKRYSTDIRLTFAGRLKINENDKDSFIYVLESAEEY